MGSKNVRKHEFFRSKLRSVQAPGPPGVPKRDKRGSKSPASSNAGTNTEPDSSPKPTIVDTAVGAENSVGASEEGTQFPVPNFDCNKCYGFLLETAERLRQQGIYTNGGSKNGKWPRGKIKDGSKGGGSGQRRGPGDFTRRNLKSNKDVLSKEERLYLMRTFHCYLENYNKGLAGPDTPCINDFETFLLTDKQKEIIKSIYAISKRGTCFDSHAINLKFQNLKLTQDQICTIQSAYLDSVGDSLQAGGRVDPDSENGNEVTQSKSVNNTNTSCGKCETSGRTKVSPACRSFNASAKYPGGQDGAKDCKADIFGPCPQTSCKPKTCVCKPAGVSNQKNVAVAVKNILQKLSHCACAASGACRPTSPGLCRPSASLQSLLGMKDECGGDLLCCLQKLKNRLQFLQELKRCGQLYLGPENPQIDDNAIPSARADPLADPSCKPCPYCPLTGCSPTGTCCPDKTGRTPRNAGNRKSMAVIGNMSYGGGNAPNLSKMSDVRNPSKPDPVMPLRMERVSAAQIRFGMPPVGASMPTVYSRDDVMGRLSNQMYDARMSTSQNRVKISRLEEEVRLDAKIREERDRLLQLKEQERMALQRQEEEKLRSMRKQEEEARRLAQQREEEEDRMKRLKKQAEEATRLAKQRQEEEERVTRLLRQEEEAKKMQKLREEEEERMRKMKREEDEARRLAKLRAEEEEKINTLKREEEERMRNLLRQEEEARRLARQREEEEEKLRSMRRQEEEARRIARKREQEEERKRQRSNKEEEAKHLAKQREEEEQRKQLIKFQEEELRIAKQLEEENRLLEKFKTEQADLLLRRKEEEARLLKQRKVEEAKLLAHRQEEEEKALARQREEEARIIARHKQHKDKIITKLHDEEDKILDKLKEEETRLLMAKDTERMHRDKADPTDRGQTDSDTDDLSIRGTETDEIEEESAHVLYDRSLTQQHVTPISAVSTTISITTGRGNSPVSGIQIRTATTSHQEDHTGTVSRHPVYTSGSDTDPNAKHGSQSFYNEVPVPTLRKPSCKSDSCLRPTDPRPDYQTLNEEGPNEIQSMLRMMSVASTKPPPNTAETVGPGPEAGQTYRNNRGPTMYEGPSNVETKPVVGNPADDLPTPFNEANYHRRLEVETRIGFTKTAEPFDHVKFKSLIPPPVLHNPATLDPPEPPHPILKHHEIHHEIRYSSHRQPGINYYGPAYYDPRYACMPPPTYFPGCVPQLPQFPLPPHEPIFPFPGNFGGLQFYPTPPGVQNFHNGTQRCPEPPPEGLKPLTRSQHRRSTVQPPATVIASAKSVPVQKPRPTKEYLRRGVPEPEESPPIVILTNRGKTKRRKHRHRYCLPTAEGSAHCFESGHCQDARKSKGTSKSKYMCCPLDPENFFSATTTSGENIMCLDYHTLKKATRVLQVCNPHRSKPSVLSGCKGAKIRTLMVAGDPCRKSAQGRRDPITVSYLKGELDETSNKISFNPCDFRN